MPRRGAADRQGVRCTVVGPRTLELIDVLDELVAVLDSDGDTHWSRWMKRAQARLKQSDHSGITYLLDAYGGMGSFNDLILGQTTAGDRFAWKPGHEELNQRFEALRDRAWQLADWIRRNHEIAGT